MEQNAAQRRHLKHELRTCLNQILGFSELLLESATEDGKVELAAKLRAILLHAESMRIHIAALTQEMSEDLVEVSSVLSSGKLQALIPEVRTLVIEALAVGNAADVHDLDQINSACVRLHALLDASCVQA